MPNHVCTFADCDKIFLKAQELRRHMVAHEDPSRVFYCPHCDYITLKRDALKAHVRIHTGMGELICPHLVTVPPLVSGSRSRQKPCNFKTYHPAVLTRHRRQEHGDTTPLNPCENTRVAVSRKLPPKKEGKASTTTSPRKQRPAPRNGVGSNAPPAEYSMSVSRREDVVDMDKVFDEAAWIGLDEELELDPHYDPSLNPGWLARYEQGFTNLTRTQYNRRPAQADRIAPKPPTNPEVRTGREGCLCPEWMVQSGIEGWNPSMLEAHKEHYTMSG